MVSTRSRAIAGHFVGRSTRSSSSKVHTRQVALCTSCANWLILRTADLAILSLAQRARVVVMFGPTFAAEHGSQLSLSLRGLFLSKSCVVWEYIEVASISLFAVLNLQRCGLLEVVHRSDTLEQEIFLSGGREVYCVRCDGRRLWHDSSQELRDLS